MCPVTLDLLRRYNKHRTNGLSNITEEHFYERHRATTIQNVLHHLRGPVYDGGFACCPGQLWRCRVTGLSQKPPMSSQTSPALAKSPGKSVEPLTGSMGAFLSLPLRFKITLPYLVVAILLAGLATWVITQSFVNR